jgi:hypothetical protein
LIALSKASLGSPSSHRYPSNKTKSFCLIKFSSISFADIFPAIPKNVVQTENDLKELFPKKSWNKLHLQMIYYGREYCKARDCYGISCKICTACYPNRKKQFKIIKA